MISSVRVVTIVTADLAASLGVYEGLLGMRRVDQWHASPGSADAAVLCRLWDLDERTGVDAVWLDMPGATAGGVRLVALSPSAGPRIVDGARPHDHGYVKNLDFFTDDVEGAYERFEAAGHRFLAPPVTYPVPWGNGVTATEAHLPTADGVKISLARLQRTPRTAFGTATRDVGFTEVAAATQIVANYDRAVEFYADVFDCVPAAETLVDDPPFVAALRLPPGTRLRMSFIGPPQAVGGKVGLVAYEGPGVGDARSLAASAARGARGVLALTFETDDLQNHVSRARLHGATVVADRTSAGLPFYGTATVATLRTPDGVLVEFVERNAPPASEFVPIMAERDLPASGVIAVATAATGRLAIAAVSGEPFAIEDRCPHLGGPLSRGARRGRRVVCPWHGWEVDVATGRVAGGEGMAARTCALRREGGQLCVRRRGAGDSETA